MSYYTATVQLPSDIVWENLLYKIKHPEAFVPTVRNVEILEDNDDYVLRKMSLTMDNQEVTIVEKITTEPYYVRYELVEHPKYTGFVINKIEDIDDQSCSLTYKMYWTDKATKKEIDATEMAKKAVLQSVEFMEKSNNVL